MRTVGLRVTQQSSAPGDCNRNCATSICDLWESMRLQGYLSQLLSGWGQDGVWLQDLVSFTVFAKKCKSNHIVSELLPGLEKEWLTFILPASTCSIMTLHEFCLRASSKGLNSIPGWTLVILGSAGDCCVCD